MRQLSKHEWVEVRFGVSTFSTSANFIHGCCCSHLPLLLIAYAPPRFSFAHRRQSVSFSASSKKSLPVVSAAKKAVSVLKAILAFEKACMEFDDLNLKPTFKILWGVPGRSNAINIAERLELPCDIINSARGLYGSASAEINEIILDMKRYKQDYQRLLNESHRYIR
ncbi:endonuclease MutS2 [Brassica napus]|uniref:endonuclease MutS2 n=1 Tax=Brassica napus TaxID=3708 RepID=UPI0006AAA493|nr:endonuclease MutS2 [Brassica napus]